MKKALLTGITGQDASYLAEILLDKGYEVHGIVRRASTFNTGRIDHITKDIGLHYGDLCDESSIDRILDKIKPDEVYNLGAQSHVKISFDIPIYTSDVNYLGSLRLLDAIAKKNKDIRYYQASSSEMFGKVVEVPQNEKTPFYPRSPYGVSKVAAYWATVNYREAYDLYACNGILFNHESPRRGLNFVTRKITHGLCMIKLGKQESLCLGNLDAKRDWGFAKEYMEAAYLMLQHEAPDDYVVATGETNTVRSFLEVCLNILGIKAMNNGQYGTLQEAYIDSEGNKIIEVSNEYFRPTEVDILIGDAKKAKEKLGWVPKTDMIRLAEMMIKSDMDLLLRR